MDECPRCHRPYPSGIRRCYPCSALGRRTGANLPCLVCGTPVYVQPNQLARGEGRYCSPKCKYTGLRGRELAPGGRYVRKDGYVAVKIGIRKYQLEHRLVVEAAIGRPLRSDEEVHHLNGDKQDNQIGNLLVVSPSEHQDYHADHVQRLARRVSLVCQQCGKGYERKASRQGESRFCSAACRSRAVSLARWHPST